MKHMLLRDTLTFGLAGLAIVVLLYVVVSSQKRDRRRNLERSVSTMQMRELCNELKSTLEERTRELEEANARVREAERIKNAFLNNIGHNIRTPLNGLLGFARMLMQDGLAQQERERYSQSLELQGAQLTRLLDNLLLLSKFDTNQFSINNKPCNLNQLVDDLYNDYYRADDVVHKQLQLRPVKALSNNEASFNADANSIKRIMQALIDNAIKFTQAGSVEFGYMLSNHNTLLFFVKDTGMGIPKEILPRVFDRFFRHVGTGDASPTHDGMGLGLTIAKDLAHIMGGHINIESEQDTGTTCYLTLPQVQLAAPSRRNLGGRRVLLIDNHVADSLYFSSQLEQAGIRTINLKSVDDAVEVGGLLLDLDAALLSWQLPFTRGDEAVNQLRALAPKLPLVAIVPTHTIPNPDPIWSGCQGMLTRDANPSMLFDMLESIFKDQGIPLQ